MNRSLVEINGTDGKPKGLFVEEGSLAMEEVTKGSIGDKVEVRAL